VSSLLFFTLLATCPPTREGNDTDKVRMSLHQEDVTGAFEAMRELQE